MGFVSQVSSSGSLKEEHPSRKASSEEASSPTSKTATTNLATINEANKDKKGEATSSKYAENLEDNPRTGEGEGHSGWKKFKKHISVGIQSHGRLVARVDSHGQI